MRIATLYYQQQQQQQQDQFNSEYGPYIEKLTDSTKRVIKYMDLGQK